MQSLSINYKNKVINLFPKSLQGFQILIIINVMLFIFLELFNFKSFLFFYFGLIPQLAWVKFYVWQFLTYLFLHDNFLHVFFIVLYMVFIVSTGF